MSYLTIKNGKLICTHPKVKEVKEWASGNADPASPFYYNIAAYTSDGKVFREQGNVPNLCRQRLEKALVSI